MRYRTVRFYRDRPVKRIRRDGEKITMILYSPKKGEPGQKQTVSQQDWAQHGRVDEKSQLTAQQLRELASTP